MRPATFSTSNSTLLADWCPPPSPPPPPTHQAAYVATLSTGMGEEEEEMTEEQTSDLARIRQRKVQMVREHRAKKTSGSNRATMPHKHDTAKTLTVTNLKVGGWVGGWGAELREGCPHKHDAAKTLTVTDLKVGGREGGAKGLSCRVGCAGRAGGRADVLCRFACHDPVLTGRGQNR